MVMVYIVGGVGFGELDVFGMRVGIVGGWGEGFISDSVFHSGCNKAFQTFC